MGLDATLSVIVPTIGQGPLARCLDSVEWQLQAGDEVIVVGDVRDGPLHGVERELAGRGGLVRYLPLAESPVKDWGHANLNAAMRRAHGAWLTFTDDDDVYAVGALDSVRTAIAGMERPAPLLFRFQTHFGYVVPPLEAAATGEIAQGHVSGHCLVVPNRPDRFGRWTSRYEGDFDWVTSSLLAWQAAGVDPVWRPEIIGLARPRE